MKNHSDLESGKVNLEQLDALELKRRAAEDAVKDADSYAFSTRPKHNRKTSGAKGVDSYSYLLKAKHASVRVGSQDGIDGVLIHSNEGKASLVLSDEILEISLPDEVAALAAEPIRIFHVQSPSPWVEQVFAGEA